MIHFLRYNGDRIYNIYKFDISSHTEEMMGSMYIANTPSNIYRTTDGYIIDMDVYGTVINNRGNITYSSDIYTKINDHTVISFKSNNKINIYNIDDLTNPIVHILPKSIHRHYYIYTYSDNLVYQNSSGTVIYNINSQHTLSCLFNERIYNMCYVKNIMYIHNDRGVNIYDKRIYNNTKPLNINMGHYVMKMVGMSDVNGLGIMSIIDDRLDRVVMSTYDTRKMDGPCSSYSIPSLHSLSYGLTYWKNNSFIYAVGEFAKKRTYHINNGRCVLLFDNAYMGYTIALTTLTIPITDARERIKWWNSFNELIECGVFISIKKYGIVSLFK